VIIEEIYTELELSYNRFRKKAISARKTALKARKSGDLQKSDKFNSVARVYEMVTIKIGPLERALLNHTSGEFQDSQMPF
jgi:hypothetical protein